MNISPRARADTAARLFWFGVAALVVGIAAVLGFWYSLIALGVVCIIVAMVFA